MPDYAHPWEWSYRDLIFVRLVAWLRSKGMRRPEVTDRVAAIRVRLAESDTVDVLRSDGRVLLMGDDPGDARTGQLAMPPVLSFLDEFDLTAPIEAQDEFGRRRHMWGPDLLTPSPRSYISPQVMGGEPCVTETRIPTGTLFALHTERALLVENICGLYDELEPSDVADALQLESRLRDRPLAA